ncbi:DMT family transporter, partial [Acinetobacter ursingii]|uniref:DMT family transporter n=1 Tax=Acinetobacter ursingii TaxID=108980 RepID=UPI0021CF3471
MLKISSQLLFFLPLALGIGVAMAIQTALNTQLRSYLHSPLQAAFLSFLVGTILLALMVLFSVHDKFHRTLILSGFCLLKIAKIS